MPTVLTFIAAPRSAALLKCVEHGLVVLRAQGGINVTRQILSEDEAVDVLVDEISPESARVAVARLLADYPVDIIVQGEAERRKSLLVADMESTIIEQEMLEEMADVLGKRAEVAAITRRAMNGEIDFVGALAERVALFANQPATLLEEMASRITYMPGAGTLVATMRGNGAQCWLASGGFRIYTQLVAAKLGFDRECANELLIDNGVLTGKVAEPVLDKNTKLSVLQQGADAMGIDLAATVAVGDGANDLPMLQACSEGGGLGIAFHAKPSVQTQAMHNIRHGDLTALLFAQGYARTEFLMA